ncbi:MAG: hypothetical protein K9J77_11290, partial [Rhodoferax sp.]|nr:hypothetical protein [Rhodoferax sp.]
MMWRVAYLRLDTRLIKSWALAILMLSAGFIVSGFGPQLPRWVTVLGTNMMLLASGAVIFSGVRAFCEQQPTRFDRVGWSIVALTALPFWFWGLIEPDGHYRAVVFSFAAALINARTAHILLRTAHHTTWSTPRNRSTAILALIFSIVTLWMAVRGVHLLFAEPVVASLRGSNPTSWLTLFWYIVLVSVATLFIFWLEFGSQTPTRTVPPVRRHAFTGVTEYSRHKLQLLWVTVLVLVLGVVSEGVLYYAKSFEWEEQRLLRSAELTNDAFVQHTLQVMGQVDTILHAVRTVFVSTGSVAETEAFIHDLPFDKSTIDNVYLISAQGKLLIAHDTEARGISMADRDYFRFQQATHGDQLFLGAVELGRVTGKFHFRVVRRINHPDGRFAGVLLCTVNPEAFSRFYQNQSDGRQGTAT